MTKVSYPNSQAVILPQAAFDGFLECVRNFGLVLVSNIHCEAVDVGEEPSVG